MQELIDKVTAAAGISEEQAKKAIETVAAYVKDRIPESFRSQIDHLVNGEKLSDSVKSQMNDIASDVRDKAEDVIKEVRGKAEEVAGKIKEMFADKNEGK